MKYFSHKIYALCILALAATTQANADITINEVMPCNYSTKINDLYNYAGWVELYNSGTSAVDLQNYSFKYLSTEDGTTKTATIDYSCSIPAGGYKLFYFDGIDNVDYHVSYKMDADGGAISLLDAKSNILCSLTVPSMPAYLSYGVKGTSTGYMEPTPEAANSGDIYESLTRCANPVFGTAPGLYVDSSSLSISISCATAGAKIYYTTNGSEPTPTNGKLYSKAFNITKNTPLRARAYADNNLPSEINTGSYLFNDSQHSLCGGFTVPIVSVVTDSANFYDDMIGICVVGKNGLAGDKSCVAEKANFNQDWQRPINFELIVNNKQAFNQATEASIMGGCSRNANNEVKAIKIGASKKCGTGLNKMKYPFFNDYSITKYKSLHLRNGGNDYGGIRFRDGFIQTLMHGSGLDYQAYRPVAYYIDGVYQGFMGLRERMTDDYVWAHYGIDEDNLDVVALSESAPSASTGDLTAYNNMISEAQTTQTDSSYFDKMNGLLDINEYLDYMIFEQFIVNTDWPANNNKLWRKRNNGRFRVMVYDTDFGFGLYGGTAPNYSSYTTDMIKFCLGEGSAVNWGNGTKIGTNSYVFSDASKWKTVLFSSLMKNPEFKSQYLIKTLMHLQTDLSTEHIKAVWDSVSNDASGEYCASHNPNANWKATYDNNASSEVNTILEFAEKRPGYVKNYLASYYGGSLVNLDITANIDSAKFLINGVRWNNNAYNGQYVSNNSISVMPLAPIGYKFDHWELSSSPSATLLDTSNQWSYYYNNDMPAANWYASNFDDAAWNTGKGKFGYGSSSTYTTPLDYGTDSENKYITSYFRSNFTINDLGQFEKLSANITYDDGFVLYINGKEVTRKNIAEGDVNNKTLASSYVNDATAQIDIPDSFLVVGNNSIAVEVHQNSVTSSDMTFELSLTGIGNSSATTSKTPLYEGTISDNLTLKAVFAQDASLVPLVLNEVCTSNQQGYADAFGNYGDWVEIYNAGDKDIDLAGMYLTDNASKRTKYQFPYSDIKATTIPAKGHKVIWTDGEQWQGADHASFKLTAGTAAPIILSYWAGGKLVTIDSIKYSANIGSNKTLGRTTDGASTWTIFAPCSDNAKSVVYLPTPGSANGSDSCKVTNTDNETVYATSSQKQISIYPNPASNIINIYSPDEITGTGIYDNAGRTIVLQQNGEHTINVSKLATGVYTIHITTANNDVRLKFIKK